MMKEKILIQNFGGKTEKEVTLRWNIGIQVKWNWPSILSVLGLPYKLCWTFSGVQGE
jgi:hypothetical protein